MDRQGFTWFILAILLICSSAVSAASIAKSPGGSGSSAESVVFFNNPERAEADPSDNDGDLVDPDWSLIFDQINTASFEIPQTGGIGQESSESISNIISTAAIYLLIIISSVLLIIILYKLRTRRKSEETDTKISEPADKASMNEQNYDISLNEGLIYDNKIHEKWHEMVRFTGVNQFQTRTPSEIADILIQRGFPADAVSEITTQFELVRYGEYPPSEDRIDSCTEAFADIEQSSSHD